MSRTYNRWILTKSCEFAPDGNLRLGQILAEPKDPAYVLQPLGPLPLHNNIKPEVTTRSNVSLSDNNELSAQFRTWANLGYIPVQFKIASAKKRLHDLDWHFEKLESRIMAPDLAYVDNAMRHGDVEESLRSWRNPFKRRVYMVTGVRIVSGAHLKRREAASTKHMGAAQGAAPDASVSAGTDANFATSSTESEEFERASDFVFAYRLNEVSYRGKISHRPYVSGETSSADKPPVRRGDEIVINDFEVLELSEVDLSDEEDDFERVLIPGHVETETFLGKGCEDNDK
jgi:hypothetical protein